MKQLSGKLTMAAIVLSSGLIVHAEPSAERSMGKRAVASAARSNHVHRPTTAVLHRFGSVETARLP